MTRRGFRQRPFTYDHTIHTRAEARAAERTGDTGWGADWEPAMTDADDSLKDRVVALQRALRGMGVAV